jgi:RimJ/RimL family protein N-acetyltransferase
MAAHQQDIRQAIRSGSVLLQPVSRAAAAVLAAGDLTTVRAGDGWPHDDSMDGLRMAAAGAGLCWLVTLDGLVIGDCGTHGPVDADGAAEIGYGVAAPYRGRGYGGQMVSALAHWLLGQPGITEVIAHTCAGNIPSRRALERAGFRLAGERDGECRYALGGEG